MKQTDLSKGENNKQKTQAGSDTNQNREEVHGPSDKTEWNMQVTEIGTSQ